MIALAALAVASLALVAAALAIGRALDRRESWRRVDGDER